MYLDLFHAYFIFLLQILLGHFLMKKYKTRKQGRVNVLNVNLAESTTTTYYYRVPVLVVVDVINSLSSINLVLSPSQLSH